jgi:hypothetical protein
MRAGRHVVAEQARRAAAVLAVTWIASVVLAASAELLTTGELPLDPIALAVAVVPSAIAVAAPLAIGSHVLTWGEDGSWAAWHALGRGPWRASALLCLPWLPLIALGSHAVDDARPAALARLADRAFESVVANPAHALKFVRGVATSRVGDHRRALLAIGDDIVALELANETTRTVDGLAVGAGRFTTATMVGSFAGASLELPYTARPLSVRSERELSSRFLARSAERFARARNTARPFDARAAVAAENARRRAFVPSLILALALALSPLSWLRTRLRPATVYGLAVAPAVAVAVTGPRIAAALAEVMV